MSRHGISVRPRLKEHSLKTGIPMSQLIEDLVDQAIASQACPPTKRVKR